jgi:hypothetical protein
MNQASSLFGVNGTPGNIIINRETGNYRLISGAYPVDDFVNAINEFKNANLKLTKTRHNEKKKNSDKRKTL